MNSSTDFIIDKKYLVKKTLCNNGQKSMVYRVTETSTQQSYAIKSIASYLKNSPFNLQPESALMSGLHHPNIVQIIEFKEEGVLSNKFFGDKNIMYIVMKIAEKGDLLGLMQDTQIIKKNKLLPIKLIRTFFSQITSAVEYLHQSGWCHRDIKLDNIFLSETYSIQLGDFGCAAPLKGHPGRQGLISAKGTEMYMAPEVLNNYSSQLKKETYDGEKCDVFSLGVLLYCMLIKQHPFHKASPSDPYYKLIIEKNFDMFWSRQKEIEIEDFEAFKELIEGMLCYDPKERFTIEEIKKTRWFKDEILNSAETIDVVQDLLAKAQSDN